MMAGYRELEAEWEQAIGKAFGLDLWRHYEEVKFADQAAFKLEYAGLMGWESSDGEARRAFVTARSVLPEIGLMEMDRDTVKELFVKEFEKLRAKAQVVV